MNTSLRELAEQGSYIKFSTKLTENLSSILGALYDQNLNLVPTFQELELHIITSAKMYGAKDNGQYIDGNLVLQFIYPEQVKHFLQWISNYNSQIGYSIQPGYDKVVGNVTEVTLSFADIKF